MINLQERRALVTGGARGIGAGIVRRLAADGASVAFTYSSSAADAEKLVAEVTANRRKAVAIKADSAIRNSPLSPSTTRPGHRSVRLRDDEGRSCRPERAGP